MNEPAHVREYLRQALALARRDEKGKRVPMPESILFEAVRRLCRDPLRVDEFRRALQWNEKNNYAACSFDDVADSDAWALTPKGLAKEGVR
jgi:hypothetical protein